MAPHARGPVPPSHDLPRGPAARPRLVTVGAPGPEHGEPAVPADGVHHDVLPPPSDGDGQEGGRRQRRRKDVRRQVIEWVVLIACALAIALVIKTFLFQAFYIPSPSMVPTLDVGDRVLVNKLSYHLHPVHRGDIVVFTAPPGVESADIKDLVKRVVGLPGDTVEGRGGHIYIDGRLLKEPYLPPGIESKTFGPEHVPAHSYFVLGDNRPSSKDSTVFGPISRSLIVGRVFVRIWPLGRLGFL